MFVIVEICERELLCMTYANTKEEASDIANTKLENIIEHKYGLSMEDYFADYGDDGDAEKSENGSNAWCNFSPYVDTPTIKMVGFLNEGYERGFVAVLPPRKFKVINDIYFYCLTSSS